MIKIYRYFYLNNDLGNYFPNILDVLSLQYLDNCIEIDLNNIDFNSHNPMRVDKYSSNEPSGLIEGVRLYFPIIGSRFVVIIIIGFKSDNNSAIWKNSYNSNVGDWSGWVEL